MTKEEMRIAIAEKCGWKKVKTKWHWKDNHKDFPGELIWPEPPNYKRFWWRFKHWFLCCCCALGIIIALLIALILEPIFRLFSSHAHSLMWQTICDLLGLTELHCRRKHKQFHSLTQIEYNGKTLIHCTRCGFSHYK